MQSGQKAVGSIPYVSVGVIPSLKKKKLHMILVMCPHVQIAFFKFTNCDNQPLVGWIPIPAVAVPLNPESSKFVSHLIGCIAITYWIIKSLRQF